MKKSEIKYLKDNELITHYVSSYSSLALNYNLGRGTKQLETLCKNLEAELMKRGILTDKDIELLNL